MTVANPVKPDTAITDFMQHCTVMTLATTTAEGPQCANCFFVYQEENNLILFKSEEKTNHVINAMKKEKVAGTILPDSLERTAIRGIQFTGSFFMPGPALKKETEQAYYSKFPIARAVPGKIWCILPLYIKFTQNHLGIKRKMEWRRIDETPDTLFTS